MPSKTIINKQVKLQKTKSMYKNALLSYISTIKLQKKKLEKKNFFCNCTRKDKMPRNKFNKGCERPIY